MAYMRVLLQQCKPGTVEMLTRKAEETLVPQLRRVRGFISYRIVEIDDRTIYAIGTFETREGAEELDRLGAEWRQQYGGDAIISVQKHLGKVILDASAQPSASVPRYSSFT